ncbi:MAG: M23 family metallopeptidase [candidate division Zixibacteria bacterium]|jgi:murein DD-endopeptidase MepM/ murein hydrolase activator NlpD|nr:M23 family metallopeptidase [candidate division Zixibacteria bacterium]
MFGSKFSVIVVPENTGEVIERKIVGWKLAVVLSVMAVFVLMTLGFTIAYFKTSVDYHKLATLKRENRYFAEKIKTLQESVESLKSQMSSIIKKDENIRLVFDLPSIDPSVREVGVGGRTFETIDLYSPTVDQLNIIEGDIDKISRQIKLENASFSDVFDKLKRKQDVLDHTPSIMPVDGYISRGMGMQVNPITGFYQMHNGIDIAAERDTPIRAPAKGRVISVGWENGMGNTICIDHGYGLVSIYGHLNAIKVRKGDMVNRNDIIGLVGSTGNSTGPHLHYEIHKNGSVVDPRRFFVNIGGYSG